MPQNTLSDGLGRLGKGKHCIKSPCMTQTLDLLCALCAFCTCWAVSLFALKILHTYFDQCERFPPINLHTSHQRHHYFCLHYSRLVQCTPRRLPFSLPLLTFSCFFTCHSRFTPSSLHLRAPRSAGCRFSVFESRAFGLGILRRNRWRSNIQ